MTEYEEIEKLKEQVKELRLHVRKASDLLLELQAGANRDIDGKWLKCCTYCKAVQEENGFVLHKTDCIMVRYSHWLHKELPAEYGGIPDEPWWALMNPDGSIEEGEGYHYEYQVQREGDDD